MGEPCEHGRVEVEQMTIVRQIFARSPPTGRMVFVANGENYTANRTLLPPLATIIDDEREGSDDQV